jgi:sec-independent protein translocase protein TatB
MFDMGFTEMMLIGIVALIVIGPERLPGVARTAGKYIGRLKRFMTTVKADVEQELRADELREILSQQQKELDSLKDSISEAGHEIEKQVNVMDDVADTPAAAGEQPAVEQSADKPAQSAAGEQPADKPARAAPGDADAEAPAAASGDSEAAGKTGS